MKTHFTPLRSVALLAALLGGGQLAVADLLIQTAGAGDTLWSSGGNWTNVTAGTAGAVPTSADDVLFTDDLIGFISVDQNVTIQSLAFTNIIVSPYLAQIGEGLSLNVTGGGGGDLMHVGTSEYVDVATTVAASISGGATLALANADEPLVVREGNASSGAHMATLDLSELDNFDATLSRMLVGVGDSSYRRAVGTLILAKTNHITLTQGDTTDGDLDNPALMVGDNGGNNNGNSSVSYLTLGQETMIYADTIRIGGQKQQGNLSFSDSFIDPSLVVRGGYGTNRVFEFGVGDESQQGSSGNPTTGTVNLSAGTSDILAETVFIGKSQTANGREAVGNLTLGAGTLDVNTLEMAYETTESNDRQAGNRTAQGTLNVNGTTVVVNNLFRMGREGGAEPTQIAALNIDGGSLQTDGIVIETPDNSISLTNDAVLISTGPIGSSDMPVGDLSLADARLTLTVASPAPVILASNLTTSGTQNAINIASLPPIPEYPVTLPLISYQGGFINGNGNNFTLGTLPAANPAFQGTIVDGGSSIALQLTSGPITDLYALWTGSTDGNWDMVTTNWINSGTPSAFIPSGEANFDDTADISTVSLVGDLSPTSIDVSNSVLAYTFTGSGHIAGASTLTKDGSESLVIANEGNNVVNVVNIKQGTMQLGDGGTTGAITAGAVTNQASLVVNRSDDLTLGSAIYGAGTLTKQGAGTLTLPGDSAYTGATMLQGGALAVDGMFTGTGTLTSSSGTTVTGNGTFGGAVQASGDVNPGAVNTFGWLSLSGDLNLATGATLTFDLNGPDTTFDPTANDYLYVGGNLSLNNNTIRVNLQGAPQVGIPYLVLMYSGTMSGTFNPTLAGTHFATTLDTSSAGVVYVTFNGTTGLNLKWNSTSDPLWNAESVNWLNLADSQPAAFYAGDSALFDDTAGVVTNITIAAGVTVTASGITNISDVNNFTIGGGGRITGSAGIHKDGTSTLTINTANDYSGQVDILGGMLRIGDGSALGDTSSGTTVASGATLDVGGQAIGTEPLTVQGAGAGGIGAIYNSGSANINATRLVTLTGDTTFGGIGPWEFGNGNAPGRWDIRGTGATLSTGGNAYNLTKVGANQVSFVGVDMDPALADIDVKEGFLGFETSTTSMGNPANTLTVREGATIGFWSSATQWDKHFVFYGNGTHASVHNWNGANVMVGPIELHGSVGFRVDSTSLSLGGVLSGDGGLFKEGGSLLVISNACTYTGDTLINAGTLALADDTPSLASSASIIISDGATLDVSARTDGTLTLASGQTLGGGGTVVGNVVAGTGTTVAPGALTGTLTASGDVTLGGTTVMEIDTGSTPTSDELAASTITYGGSLVITNIGGAITGTNTFQLFSGTLSGSFAEVTLPNIAGVTWDTSKLESDGTVTAVGPNIDSSPVDLGVVLVGGNTLQLTWPASHIGWELQWQTNAPGFGLGTGWETIDGSDGTNQVSIPIDTELGSAFFRLVLP